MTTPISFTIRPPSAGASASSSRSASPAAPASNGYSSPPSSSAAPFRISAPIRPSPLSRSTSAAQGSSRPGPRYGRPVGGNEHVDGESDDDDELIPSRKGGDGRRIKKDEEIVGFGEDGIESLQKKKPTGPLVIPSLPNRDWRQSSHAVRKPNYVPESQARREVKKEDLIERTGDEPVQAGLQLTSSRSREGEVVKQEDVEMEDGSASVKVEESQVKTEPGTEVEDSLETRAMKALMMEQNGEAKKSDLVIGLNEDTMDLRSHPVDETDAFRRDVLTRPAESTLDDYAATPIEAFGEALLRGMGWNPDATKVIKIHAPKRRPDGLGLGATAKVEDSTNGSKSGQKKRPDPSKRAGRGYVPVVRKEREGAGTSSEVSRSGTASRVASRSPDSRDSRDSRRRTDDRDGRESSSRRDYDRDDRDRRRRDRDAGENHRSGYSTPRNEDDRRSDKHRSSRNDDDDDGRRQARRDSERKGESNRYSSSDHHRDKERQRDRDKHVERR